MARVNPGRRYDASGRQRQAERTRAAILATASELFTTSGYAATTVAAVADRAGVSVETVYKAFGPKSALVRALWEQGLAGTGPRPAQRRSDQVSTTNTDAGAIIREWGALMREVAPAVTPILLLIRAAAGTDPDMAKLLTETEKQRRERMRTNARRLHGTGQVKPGLARRQVADILWLYSAPEVYEVLVLKAGWPVARYADFVVQAMTDALVARR